VSRGWRDALPYYPLLPLGAGIALVWAAAGPDSYFRLAQLLAFPINEIGVAFGLAWLAQEVLESRVPGGSMSFGRRTWMAVAMALGGALVAAATYAIYVRLSDESVLLRGWPIVCGVDVFFGVAVARSIFRRGTAVTVVTMIALVSDVVALVLVSRRPFVTNASGAGLGLIALAVAMSLLFRRADVRSMWAYLLVAGPLAWFGCYWAGLHPALALLPIVPFFRKSARALGDFSIEHHDHGSSTHFESALAIPLQVVAFLFGFVNAGVLWREFGTGTWAVLTACLAGRPLGMLLTAALWQPAWRRHLRWSDLIVIAFIGSIGSVFALFLSTAVFPDGPLLAEAKLGAIATLGGVLLAAGAARALRVGRFLRGRQI
jgi:Na+:H+ antiporter, NhaA family